MPLTSRKIKTALIGPVRTLDGFVSTTIHFLVFLVSLVSLVSLVYLDRYLFLRNGIESYALELSPFGTGSAAYAGKLRQARTAYAGKLRAAK